MAREMGRTNNRDPEAFQSITETLPWVILLIRRHSDSENWLATNILQRPVNTAGARIQCNGVGISDKEYFEDFLYSRSRWSKIEILPLSVDT